MSQVKGSQSYEPDTYQILIKGQIDVFWSAWFEGLELSLTPHGNSLLTGSNLDQAALYGILKKVRNSGMTLVSLHCLNHPAEI